MNLTRRGVFRLAGGLALGAWGASGIGPWLGEVLAQQPGRRRQGILLWMTGGPSQLDTFDPKPEHPHGGEFRPIETAVPGLWISEHLPLLAQQARHLAVVRGLSTAEGDHGRGTFLMRTGYRPTGPLAYPPLGSALAKELGDEEAELPNYVSIAPYEAFDRRAFGSGFLGPRYSPLVVRGPNGPPPEGEWAELSVSDVELPRGLDATTAQARFELWQTIERERLAGRATPERMAHQTLVRRAWRLATGSAARALDLSEEPAEVREAYGRGVFGQGCLLARRLIERGVAFVEVSLGQLAENSLGWDTHQNNFPAVRGLSAELDAGWARLLADLDERGLLATTTILWTGEFGRTPVINNNAGRDHFPAAWSSVLAGGGIQGGQAHGRTSPDGQEVVEGRLSAGDLLATFCQALGVDPATENISDLGRPIRLAEGQPVAELLA